jgi:hypothetical protein
VYTTRFALSNARSLINVGADLRQLLESGPAQTEVGIHAAISRSTGTPAPIEPAPPASTSGRAAHDRVLDWIARIESYKGAVARRNALTRAMEEISEPEGRRSLVLAASKIEVAAVLDKVDTLATPAAKQRHLEKPISELQADDIPDDLQIEELAMLQTALRSLGSSAPT